VKHQTKSKLNQFVTAEVARTGLNHISIYTRIRRGFYADQGWPAKQLQCDCGQPMFDRDGAGQARCKRCREWEHQYKYTEDQKEKRKHELERSGLERRWLEGDSLIALNLRLGTL